MATLANAQECLDKMGRLLGRQFSTTGTFPYLDTDALKYLQDGFNYVAQLFSLTELETQDTANGDLTKGVNAYNLYTDFELDGLLRIIDVSIKEPFGTITGYLTGAATDVPSGYTVFCGGFAVASGFNSMAPSGQKAIFSIELPVGSWQLQAAGYQDEIGTSDPVDLAVGKFISGVEINVPAGGTEQFFYAETQASLYRSLTYLPLRSPLYKNWVNRVQDGVPMQFGVEGQSLVLIPAPNASYGSGLHNSFGNDRLRILYTTYPVLSLSEPDPIPWPMDCLDAAIQKGAELFLTSINRSPDETDKLNRIEAKLQEQLTMVTVNRDLPAVRELGQIIPDLDISDYYYTVSRS